MKKGTKIRFVVEDVLDEMLLSTTPFEEDTVYIVDECCPFTERGVLLSVEGFARDDGDRELEATEEEREIFKKASGRTTIGNCFGMPNCMIKVVE